MQSGPSCALLQWQLGVHMSQTFKCHDCGTEKVISQYHKKANLPRGHANQCKECNNAATKAARLRAKTECFAAYSNNMLQCVCCGEAELRFLSLDHIDGGGAAHRRSNPQRNWSYGLYIELRRAGYPPGYRVLCFNCNFAYGHYETCPHQERVLQFSSR